MNTLDSCDDIIKISDIKKQDKKYKKRIENIKNRIMRLEKRKVYEKMIRHKKLLQKKTNNKDTHIIIMDNTLYSYEF